MGDDMPFETLHAWLVEGRQGDVMEATEGASSGLAAAARVRALNMVGRTAEALDLGASVLARALRDGDLPTEAWCRFYLASCHATSASRLRGMQLALQAIEVAERADLPLVRAGAWAMLADLRSQLGDNAGALAALEHASEGPPTAFGRFRIASMQVLTHLRRGDLAGCRAELAAAEAHVAPRTELVWWEMTTLLELSAGRFDEALHAAERMVAVAAPDRSSVARAVLADVLRLHGRVDEARDRLEQVALAPEAQPEGDALVRVMIGLCDLDLGRIEGIHDALTPLLHGRSLVGALAWAGLARDAAMRDLPGQWDALWERSPIWLGYPVVLGREVALVAEACGAADPVVWGSRAVRSWARVAELAGGGGVRWLLERAEGALTELVASGAPIPLGPLVVSGRLGQGKQAAVHRARTLHGREVAVKVGLGARERGYELRIAASLDHAQVAPVLAYGTVSPVLAPLLGTEPDARWLALPLAEGSLTGVAGQLGWADCRRLLTDLLRGLAHVHARGLLHLDVKPDNVLLDGAPLRARLTDFGISRTLDRCVGRGPVVGTAAYMAPEQFDGDLRRLGPWTDLYALGITAYALIAGELPFWGSIAELWTAHRERELPRLEPDGGVPDGFDPWIAGLTAKRPAARYQRAADALRDLSRLGAPLPRPIRPRGRVDVAQPTLELSDPGLASLPTLVLEPTHRAEALQTPGEQRGPRPTAVPAGWRDEAPQTLPLDAAAQVSLLQLREAPFVGRIAERDLLWSTLRRCAVGRRGAVVWLEGPAGAGASRLARWLADTAHERAGAHVWTSQPDPGGDVVLRTLQRVVRAAARGDVAADLLAEQLTSEGWPTDLATDLAGAVTGVADLTHGGALGLLHRALAHQARERPVVWVIDDLPDVAELRSAVSACVDLDGPVLVVASATDRAQVTAVADPPEGARRVRLEPLTEIELLQMIARLLPLEPVAARRMVTASGGWPGAVVARLRAWAADGSLHAEQGEVHLRAGAPTEERSDPWSDRVLAALGDLRLGDVVAAELLGVLGPSVRTALWEAACARVGIVGPGTTEAMLVEHQLLVGDDDGVRLVHPAVGRALVEHARAAGRDDVLHEAALSLVEEPARRAPLLHASGRVLEASRAWLQACDEAIRRGELDRGAVHLQAAESSLEGCDPQDPCHAELIYQRAHLAEHRGQLVDCVRHLRAMLALAESRRWAAAEATACLYLARHEGARDDGVFEAFLARSEALYARLDDQDGQSRCSVMRGRRAWTARDLDAARSHMERAIDLAGDATARVFAQRDLAMLLAEQGREVEAAATLEGAIEDSRGAPSTALMLRKSLATLARYRGDLAEAERQLRLVLGARPIGMNRWTAELDLALVLWALGRDDEALALTPALRARVASDGSQADVAVAYVELVAVAQADDTAWAAQVAELREWGPRYGDFDADVALCLELAANRAALGDRPERVADVAALRHAIGLHEPTSG